MKMQNLFIEPYRPFFLSGALYSIIIMLFWAFWVHNPAIVASPQNISLSWLHAFLMIYLVIGFFVFGFLLTAYPRWTNSPATSFKSLLFFWLMMNIGTLASLLSHLHHASMVPLALGAAFTSYLSLTLFLLKLYLRSQTSKENQPLLILLSLLSATVGIFFFIKSLILRNYFDYRLSRELGIYFYLLLAVIGVTWRIVPYFISRVIPEYQRRVSQHFLNIVFLLCLIRTSINLSYPDHSSLNIPLLTCDTLLLGVMFREWARWYHRDIIRKPMLSVLYLSLFWIIIFFLLSILSDLGKISRINSLHVLFIGSWGTILIGIGTRVIRGHGGLKLVMDRHTLTSVILLQISVLCRLIGGLTGLKTVITSSAVLWVLAFLLWSFRYIPILFWPLQSENKFSQQDMKK